MVLFAKAHKKSRASYGPAFLVLFVFVFLLLLLYIIRRDIWLENVCVKFDIPLELVQNSFDLHLIITCTGNITFQHDRISRFRFRIRFATQVARYFLRFPLV